MKVSGSSAVSAATAYARGRLQPIRATVPYRASGAAHQREGRHFERRRSEKERTGHIQSDIPVGNYFGVLADTGPGPVNFIDVHPRLQTSLPHGVSVSTDLVAQWRESLYDGVYAVSGFLLVPAGGSRGRFVGYRPGVEVLWQIDRHAYLQADYGVFFAGQFLKQESPGRNLNYMWAGYKFK
jgi:hypothetical protein